MSIAFVISAPSGAGKSTLIRRLLESDPGLLFSVSYTTRQPRPGEVPGVAYHFVGREEFLERLQRGEFLEWAEVFGNYYGTHRSYYEQACRTGRDLVLDIDTEGARQLRLRLPEVVSIFILPPSRAILEHRLRQRGQDSPEAIERRLREAAREAQRYLEYDYVVVNDVVEQATQQLLSIVQAERCRRHRMDRVARVVLESFRLSNVSLRSND